MTTDSIEELVVEGETIKKPLPEVNGTAAVPTTNDDSIVSESLLLAELGLRLFPCHSIVPVRNVCDCYGKKRGCAPGKHPRTRSGVKDATTNEAAIRKWWKQWPDANVAIAAGNGLVVIDVDPDRGGLESLAKLEAEYGPLPKDWSVATGGGGQHIYLTTAEDMQFKNLTDWRPGIDIRSEGGYVIAPPSNHVSGNQYTWISRGSKVPPSCPDNFLLALPIKQEQSATVVKEPKPAMQDWYKRKAASSIPDSSNTTTEYPEYTEVMCLLCGNQGWGYEIREAMKAAVELSVPDCLGTRNTKLMELSRRLKGISKVRSVDAETLEPLVRAWHQLAEPKIKDPYPNTWEEWLRIWPSTRTTIDEDSVLHGTCQ